VNGSGVEADGWFITVEGPEGAGKTTLAADLARGFEREGRDIRLTREPGGTLLGERIRDVILARTDATSPTDPLTDALLFNAARRQLVGEVIRPAMAAGQVVVCARFADSTLAYQGYGAGIPLAALRDLERAATDGLRPDLTILLDLPAEDGLKRKGLTDLTRFETEFDLAFHRRVRDGFLALAAAEPDRFVVIDAGRSPAEVLRAARSAVDRRMGSGEPRSTKLRTTV
jgi:dTMP kinase